MTSSVNNEKGLKYGETFKQTLSDYSFYKDLILVISILRNIQDFRGIFSRNVRIRTSSNMQHLSDARGLLVRNIIFVITVIIRIRFNYLI